MSEQKSNILQFVSVAPLLQGVSSIFLAFVGVNWFVLSLVTAIVEWVVNWLFVHATSHYRNIQLLMLSEVVLCLGIGLAATLSFLASFQLWGVGVVTLIVFTWGGIVIYRWRQSVESGLTLQNPVSLAQIQQAIQEVRRKGESSNDPASRLLASLVPVILGLTYAIGTILNSKAAASTFALLLTINAFTLFMCVLGWGGYHRIVEWERRTGQKSVVQELEDLKNRALR